MTGPALDSEETWDAVVVGVGGMGSAALHHLSRRGARVLGLERFTVPHGRGSSHGGSRIIRLAYFEHPSYVPLVRRSYELWRALEEESGEALLRTTGSVDAGPPGGALLEGSLSSCRQHDIPHEVLTSRELSQRFPGFRLPSDHHAVWQPDGGVLDPERCVRSYVELALARGCALRTGARVSGWEAEGDGVRVRWTDAEGREGEARAGALVLTTGAWSGPLLGLTSVLSPERQVVAWLRPFTPEVFTPERFPVFNVAVEEGHYYGFPDLDGAGLKVGRFHHLEERVDPDAMERAASEGDLAVLQPFVQRYLPEAAGPVQSSETCLFTNTPDRHFIVDLLPGPGRVVVGAGFSGHGFKFASLVGELLADLALEGRTFHDLSLFRLSRFREAEETPLTTSPAGP